MIFYATKQTMERYKLKAPEEFSDPVMRGIVQTVYERERGDCLLEWGAKLFYFDRRKCIQLCNFASKFTVVLVDIKAGDRGYIGNFVAQYMMDIYSKDRKMTALLERFFQEHPMVCFAKLTDRKIIAALNHFQTGFLEDGDRLYDYFEGNTLQTRRLNRDINWERTMAERVDGKEQYLCPAEKFATLLKQRYARQ